MSYSIFEALQLVGALALFLYGMKLMSESLQKVAGDNMRNILAAMTSNRLTGVVTGLFITAIIQSSSATTVMVVSFVNAGLLDLVGSIGIIMGANVGTTFTGWLVSVLGIGKFSMTAVALPIIGCALPFMFSNSRSRKNWGELLIGFGLLFIAIRFLNDAMPSNLEEYPGVAKFVQDISFLGFRSWMIFLLIGSVLTMIFQSSSATVTLTLLMCYKGWIGYEDAAAMVMGENIGTTITANLAAWVANVQAKRAALAHFVINVFGVLWIFVVYHWFLTMIGDMCVSMHISEYNPIYTDPEMFKTLNITDPEKAAQVRASLNMSMPLVLALFNTVAKGANVAVLIWFTRPIARLVSCMIKSKNEESNDFSLKHIKIGLLSTPDASLFQAKQEIALYARNTQSMYRAVVDSFDKPEKDFRKDFEKFQQMEDETDDVEVKIADYLTKVSESRLTTENTQRIRAMLKIVSEIESVADSALNIAKAIDRRNTQGVRFPDELDHKLKSMFSIVDDVITEMCNNLSMEYKEVNPKKAYELESSLNDFRTILKQEHLIAIEEKRYSYPAGILYSDLFSECEKTGDYAINVTQAIKEIGAN